MTNVYKVARTWQYLMAGASVALILVCLLPVFAGEISIDYIGSVLVVGGILGVLSYGVMASKIITSPDGIEYRSFGLRVQGTWDQVEKMDINPYGFVNLRFKKSLFKNRLAKGLFHPFAYDKTIQLSPYLDDLATSKLLHDIEKYIPANRLPKSLAKHKRSHKPYQRVSTIGLYYLGWVPFLILLIITLPKWAKDLEASGLSHIPSVSQVTVISLFVGLLANAVGLLGYNSDIADLTENNISHLARAYYLGPIVAFLLGFLIGIGMWFIIRAGLIVVSENSYGMFSLIGILSATVSVRVRYSLERLLFQGKRQRGSKTA